MSYVYVISIVNIFNYIYYQYIRSNEQNNNFSYDCDIVSTWFCRQFFIHYYAKFEILCDPTIFDKI